MKSAAKRFIALSSGAMALCAVAYPATAAPWTQAGASTGVPAGVFPDPGLYFIGSANYGAAGIGNDKYSGVAVQGFNWVPGWTFLGASYAAGAYSIESEFGFGTTSHLADVYNPEINPISLSWNLGNNFFASVGEFIYIPVNTNQTFSSVGATSGWAFEQHGAISYATSEWIASANVSVGITTADAIGVRQPDYLNLDLTLLKEFGKWRLGPVAYGSWDIETTAANAAVGKAVAIGVGGLVGYNFGPLDLSFRATHQVDGHGDIGYGKDDTRVWATIVIPVWTPAPPAPKAVAAKY